jgi:hypothetical protein
MNIIVNCLYVVHRNLRDREYHPSGWEPPMRVHPAAFIDNAQHKSSGLNHVASTVLYVNTGFKTQ